MAKTYFDYLPKDGNFNQEELWEAIAEVEGLDVNEIRDSDLAAWI